MVGCATEEGRPPGCALFIFGGIVLSSTYEGAVAVHDRPDLQNCTAVHVVADPVASSPHRAEVSPPLDQPLRAWLWMLLAGRDGV